MNADNSTPEPKDTLKFFLKEEIESARERLKSLTGRLRADEFNSLDAQLNDLNATLDSLKDEDQTQLFILRRQISLVRENMESLAVKQSWWSKLPVYARILVITVPVILYLCVLAAIQRLNQEKIYNYPATQTALASQTMLATQPALPAITGTSTPAQTQDQ
jgi:hypothetical protein